MRGPTRWLPFGFSSTQPTTKYTKKRGTQETAPVCKNIQGKHVRKPDRPLNFLTKQCERQVFFEGTPCLDSLKEDQKEMDGFHFEQTLLPSSRTCPKLQRPSVHHLSGWTRLNDAAILKKQQAVEVLQSLLLWLRHHNSCPKFGRSGGGLT